MLKRIDDIWSDSTIIHMQTIADNLLIQFERYDGSMIAIKFNTLIGVQIKPGWGNPEYVEGVLILDTGDDFSELVANMLKDEEEPIDGLKVYQIIDADQTMLVEIIAKSYTIESN